MSGATGEFGQATLALLPERTRSSKNRSRLPWDWKGQRLERRPPYHPTVLLEIDVEAASNRVQPSRRLARPCQRNLEPMGFDRPACAGLQDRRRIQATQWRRQSQRRPTLKPFS
ncbi:hypothetical protein [Burkholderia vietnamiensis]|uniref:hypothetical protein n=1 Tax=Burkholderia vietnamiensis TaxID=60552 RepID=UPI000A476114|nr:hypothetical protein [Burkholderia vietnamiensis]MDN7926286.1 hypothetical protein [Burkholderia vietnamiensis]HDR9252061.1 hypothetical protein [Burkholderia vietnamiensis]